MSQSDLTGHPSAVRLCHSSAASQLLDAGCDDSDTEHNRIARLETQAVL